MARLIHHYAFLALPISQPLDPARLLIVLTQLAVLGGIGVILALALINTVVGAPNAAPGYPPYQ